MMTAAWCSRAVFVTRAPFGVWIDAGIGGLYAGLVIHYRNDSASAMAASIFGAIVPLITALVAFNV